MLNLPKVDLGLWFRVTYNRRVYPIPWNSPTGKQARISGQPINTCGQTTCMKALISVIPHGVGGRVHPFATAQEILLGNSVKFGGTVDAPCLGQRQ